MNVALYQRVRVVGYGVVKITTRIFTDVKSSVATCKYQTGATIPLALAL